MNIDLAIYTAVDSFGWQEQSTYGEIELDRFYMRIMSFPGDLTNKLPFARFFIQNGKLVFARFFKTLMFSRTARNSLYIVLGAIDVKSVDSIDFSVLLQMPEIAGPCDPFPSHVEYNGPEANPSLTIDEECVDRRFNGSDLLKSIGLIAKNAEELRTEIEDRDGALYATLSYRPVPRKPTLTLADRMVLTKEPLAGLLEVLCEVGDRDLVNRCRKEYSDESIPSTAILNDLTRGFVAMRNQIVNGRYLEEKCSEMEAANRRLKTDLIDANHECQSLRQRLNQAEQELRYLKEKQDRPDSSPMPEDSVKHDNGGESENDIVEAPLDLKKKIWKFLGSYLKRVSTWYGVLIVVSILGLIVALVVRFLSENKVVQKQNVAVEVTKSPVHQANPVVDVEKEKPTREVSSDVGEKPKTGDTKTVTLPGGEKMVMIYCAPETFMMGSLDEKGASPHPVVLTKGFWLGKYEVTQAQWESVMKTNPAYFKGRKRPVESVTWKDCEEFIKEINSKTCLNVRFPTEAEWEYACRAGTKKAYSGSGKIDDMGWHKDNSSGETHPVGKKKANAWGFHDMHGNVWEWCGDYWHIYTEEKTIDPTGPGSGGDRVLRGGAFDNFDIYCRSTSRVGANPDPGFGVRDQGFRLCCSAGPQE